MEMDDESIIDDSQEIFWEQSRDMDKTVLGDRSQKARKDVTITSDELIHLELDHDNTELTTEHSLNLDSSSSNLPISPDQSLQFLSQRSGITVGDMGCSLEISSVDVNR